MEPPEPPLEADCCNSGCNPCIFDVYETQFQKYQEYCRRVGSLESSEYVNCISLTSYTKFTLTDKKQLASNVFLYKFLYCDIRNRAPNCFIYKPGQYLLLRAKDHEGEFTRAYTPIPVENEPPLGFTVLVRTYSSGRMSRYLRTFQVGHTSSWRGPYGDINLNYNYKYLLFIAQGTGIAPLYAIINQIVHNEGCECFIKLFFCCKHCDDILLRDELYELSSYWNFSYEVFLSSNVSLVVKYNEAVHETKLTSEDLQSYISDKMGSLQTLICGSEAFNQDMKSKIEQIGIKSSHIYLF